MEFPTELIPKLIPEEFPPERYFVAQAIELAESIEHPTIRRSYFWASALVIAGFESNIPIPSRLSGVSAGFVFVYKNSPSVTDRMNIIGGLSFGINIFLY